MDRQRRPYFAIGYATESVVMLQSDIKFFVDFELDIYMLLFTDIGLKECRPKLEDPIDARKDNFMKIALLR